MKKILLIIILGAFLSISCNDDGNGQPHKKMKMTFICNKLNKSPVLLRASDLSFIKMPDKIKSYICDYKNESREICCAMFTDPSNLYRHKKEQHGEKKRLKCDYEDEYGKCSKSYSRKEALTKHKKKAHEK